MKQRNVSVINAARKLDAGLNPKYTKIVSLKECKAGTRIRNDKKTAANQYEFY